MTFNFGTVFPIVCTGPGTNIERKSYLNVEVKTFRVTRQLPTADSHNRWELKCGLCGDTKSARSFEIRCTLEGENRIPDCFCQSGRLSTEAVFSQFGLNPVQLKTAVAVLAHERVYGRGPLRLDVEELLKRDPQSGSLVKKGWLIATGHPNRLTVTAKARKLLGEIAQ